MSSITTNVACTLTQETGPCRGYFRKFTFDSVGDVCQEFIYGGCGGNENRFDTLLECEKHCPVGRATDACSQPEVAGSCMAYFKRYTYDAVSQTCKEFIYGGCGGNDNRFDTLAECQSRCQPSERGVPPVNPIDFNMETQVRDNICTLQQDSGPCRGLFRKFAYNSLTSGCQEFGYGGCGGNDNRFDTIGECESKCLIGNNEDACSLPIVTGPCRAILPRYAYDSVSNACSEFIYGGCSGNENRFETLQQCQNRCYPKEVPSAGGCDVVSCVVPIVVIVVLVIAATIVVLFLVRKRRSKSEKYRPTAVDEPEVEVDQNEMKTVPDDAVA